MQTTKQSVLALLFATQASAQIPAGSFEFTALFTPAENLDADGRQIGPSPYSGYLYLTMADDGTVGGRVCSQNTDDNSFLNLSCPTDAEYTVEAKQCTAVTGVYSSDGSAFRSAPNAEVGSYKGDTSTSNIFFADAVGNTFNGLYQMTDGVLSFEGTQNLVSSSDQSVPFAFSQASCVTYTDILNGSTNSDTVAADMVLTTASSLTTCETTEDCTGEELCASMDQSAVESNDAGEELSHKHCVADIVCGTMGKRNGLEFFVNCDFANTSYSLSDVSTMLDNVEGVVNRAPDYTPWSSVRNLKVPSRDNYQTGWWTRSSDYGLTSLWSETDKEKYNSCNANSACAEDECCMFWPDSNNKRCQARSKSGQVQTLFPFDKWTPVCAADANATPGSGLDDLVEDAVSNAAEALTKFRELVEFDARQEAGYQQMTEDEQEEFNETRDTRYDIFTGLEIELKLKAGFDTADCDATCKTIWLDEFLEWSKDVYNVCYANSESIECRDFVKIKQAEEEARTSDGFYTKSAEEREEFEAGREEARAATKAILTAAYIEENKPAAGEEGSECGPGAAKCTNETHCCGTATPSDNAPGVTTGELTGICAVEVDVVAGSYTDKLGRSYSHECGAKALLASATAALAAIFLM